MEIEKVIRIVALFMVIATFGIYVASRLMFPASSPMTVPLGIVLLLSTAAIWRDTRKKETNE